MVGGVGEEPWPAPGMSGCIAASMAGERRGPAVLCSSGRRACLRSGFMLSMLLVELSTEQSKPLIADLDARGFTMPGLRQ